MDAKIYNQKGEAAGAIKLPEKIFDLPWNPDLVHQVVISMQSNARFNTADSKGRGEVRGGGKKPWRQKGTGRARHGSSRSPIWRGGGVTHGPTNERNYDKKINKKTKTKALFTVLSQKLRDNEILFLQDVELGTMKTKVAATTLQKLSTLKGFEKLNYKKGNRAIVTMPTTGDKIVKSFRNIPSVSVTEVRNLNPLELLNYQYLVIARPEESLAVLGTRAGNK